MQVRAWRFITIMLTALSAAMAVCHLLELPAKMRYEAPLYVTVQKSLYQLFGTVGAVFEVGALLTTPLLAFLVRERRPAFSFTVFASVCMAVAHAAWWVFIQPVNVAVRGWTAESVPSGWTRLRDRWEYTHAARAILMLVGLGSLVASVLLETPGETRPTTLHELYARAA